MTNGSPNFPAPHFSPLGIDTCYHSASNAQPIPYNLLACYISSSLRTLLRHDLRYSQLISSSWS